MSVTSAHSGSQHDRSVLLKHSLLLLLKAGDSEPMDLEASLKHTHPDVLGKWKIPFEGQKAAAIIMKCSQKGFICCLVTFPMKRDRNWNICHLFQVEFLHLLTLCLLCFLWDDLWRRHKPTAADRKHRKRISGCLQLQRTCGKIENGNKKIPLESKQQAYRHRRRSWTLLPSPFLSRVLKNNNFHLILGSGTWRQHED